MVKFETREQDLWVLTEEGAMIAKDGSHEVKVFNFIPSGPEGCQLSALKELGESGKIGQGQAFKNKWICLVNGERLVRLVESVEDKTKGLLESVAAGQNLEESTMKDLKKRKLIDRQKCSWYCVEKGVNFSLTLERLSTDLTAEMVQSGAWRSSRFKNYNFEAAGPAVQCGHLHPLLKVREEFRQIFFEMGFTEMATNNYVESSFWNFDTLFQPQMHPSRDAHDTFFLQSAARTLTLPADYVERTKRVHEEGGYGSIGHRYAWKEEESRKNILRTHTTAVSSRMLHALAQEAAFRPVKYFSIDKVFRNETVDATHLAEFHQIEGLVADYNLTLGDLIGMLKAFFGKLGLKQLRFKPAFNPYTEPSMEVFSYHEGLGKWVEIGNSGIFRPEMLQPMGFDPRVSVIAWGLSLERPTMIKYKVSNIRDLVGHKVDLNMVQTNPICRLDK